jgi:hypothetical protein
VPEIVDFPKVKGVRGGGGFEGHHIQHKFTDVTVHKQYMFGRI